MKTIVHLSDIHFGRTDDAVVAAIVPLVHRLEPNVVVVSGDLTQRAKPHQFRAARRFLDDLPKPQVVVPGNHDVPLYNLFQRFLQPLTKYRRFITRDLEPFYCDDEIAVGGINTARSLTFKDGRVNEGQMRRLHARLAPLADSITKIVVTHHPFDLPAGFDEEHLVGRAGEAMEVFLRAGADVLLAGHLHTSHIASTAVRYPVAGRAALVVQAGTATSTRGRGEHNSFNRIRSHGDLLHVDRWTWDPERGAFHEAASEAFAWSEAGWKAAG
ncbi:metallophosphoesterase family protein [Caenimonas terrae]|uniref:Metallophosphoesterase family protein n=1 Tax=Caenimonas terrae TaxID=696074 RepID=A0ABW0NBS8_9BURK